MNYISEVYKNLMEMSEKQTTSKSSTPTIRGRMNQGGGIQINEKVSFTDLGFPLESVKLYFINLFLFIFILFNFFFFIFLFYFFFILFLFCFVFIR